MVSRQTFLQHLQSQYQARLDDGYCHFPEHSAGNAAAHIMLLDHYQLLQVQGPDSERFLQGQLSCDVREVNSGCARWGTYNNPKGRMHASFLITGIADSVPAYQLRMSADIAEHCKQVLSKYIVFSKADIESLAEEWLVLGLQGTDAGAALEKTLGISLSNDLSVHNGEGWQCILLSRELHLYELHLSLEQATKIWDRLCESAKPVNRVEWDKALIELGMAEVRAENLETLIPQMMNFDLNGGINFKKGCYTGQEVIARLHYRGEAKQRLFRISGPQAVIGTELFTEARRSAVGEVVAWYQDGASGKGLAVLRIDSADQTLKDASGGSFQAEAAHQTPEKNLENASD